MFKNIKHNFTMITNCYFIYYFKNTIIIKVNTKSYELYSITNRMSITIISTSK